jgi:S-adenosylmethionine hydrolase
VADDAGRTYDTVSFLSDYGHADEFVGVVHSVIHQLSPGTRIIDITHGIPPYDVRAAGLTLARSVQYLSPGVIIAVVDPGVGTHRRPIAVEVGDGRAVFIGPDNGVLAPAVGLLGGATRAVWLNDPEYQLPAHGPLFDGRDVFAPAAAHLCNGVPLDELGEVIDTATLFPGVLPITRQEDGALIAEVLWVDRYGNAQLNVDPEELDSLGGDHFEVLVDHGRRTARRVTAFDEIGVGAVGLVVDSYGLIALAARQASAAEDLGVGPGDAVTLRPIDDPGDEAAVTPVRVTFGRRGPGPSGADDPEGAPGGAG